MLQKSFSSSLNSSLVRYNLSTYPFLNSVPDNDEIDFKCDGHHDGFYASIKYNCQASAKKEIHKKNILY